MCHGELVSTKNVHDSSRSAISEPECLTDNLTAEVFPFSLHRSKNLHLRLEQRRLRFQTLNERHQPLTVRLYGEPEAQSTNRNQRAWHRVMRGTGSYLGE